MHCQFPGVNFPVPTLTGSFKHFQAEFAQKELKPLLHPHLKTCLVVLLVVRDVSAFMRTLIGVKIPISPQPRVSSLCSWEPVSACSSLQPVLKVLCVRQTPPSSEPGSSCRHGEPCHLRSGYRRQAGVGHRYLSRSGARFFQTGVCWNRAHCLLLVMWFRAEPGGE